MKALLRAIGIRLGLIKPDLVYVMLTYRHGEPKSTTLGPMDRFSAEVLLVNRLNPIAAHGGRPLASARIVVQ